MNLEFSNFKVTSKLIYLLELEGKLYKISIRRKGARPGQVDNELTNVRFVMKALPVHIPVHTQVRACNLPTRNH